MATLMVMLGVLPSLCQVRSRIEHAERMFRAVPDRSHVEPYSKVWVDQRCPYSRPGSATVENIAESGSLVNDHQGNRI